MAIPQRDETYEEIERLDALRKYVIMQCMSMTRG